MSFVELLIIILCVAILLRQGTTIRAAEEIREIAEDLDVGFVESRAIEDLNRAHSRRVSELLNANGELVERSRAAERQLRAFNDRNHA